MGNVISMRSKIFLALILAPVFLFPQEYQIGNSSINFIDPQRNNRNIPTEIFYPADITGTDVDPANGIFPLIVYGHGFAMNYDSYEFLWEALVPQGYILAFPKTESSIIPFPDHEDFGLDMAFLVDKIKELGLNESSPFFGKISANTSVMGHSMGGGAAFLAAANNPGISTIVTFAPAETDPSAIAAAMDVSASAIIFSGENDCVTPPAEHQIPMYNNLPDGQKILITINGGGHCYFADYNFFCSLGENSCSPSPVISREEQQQAVLSLLLPFLDFRLTGIYQAWEGFKNLLLNMPGIEVNDGWEFIPEDRQIIIDAGWNAIAFDPPPINVDLKSLFGNAAFSFSFFQNGEAFFTQDLPENFIIDPDQACLIKSASSDTLSYAGFPIENRSFVLESGWNIMPVLCSEELITEQLFGAGGLPVYIREIFGLDMLWPDAEIYKLELLQPHSSYMVFSNEERMIVFP